MVERNHKIRRDIVALAIFISLMTAGSCVLGSAKFLKDIPWFGETFRTLFTPALWVAFWFGGNPHQISLSTWILGCFVEWSVIGSFLLLSVSLVRRLVVTLSCSKPN